MVVRIKIPPSVIMYSDGIEIHLGRCRASGRCKALPRRSRKEAKVIHSDWLALNSFCVSTAAKSPYITPCFKLHTPPSNICIALDAVAAVWSEAARRRPALVHHFLTCICQMSCAVPGEKHPFAEIFASLYCVREMLETTKGQSMARTIKGLGREAWRLPDLRSERFMMVMGRPAKACV